MAYKIRKPDLAFYHVVSGKTHRVVARTKKLATARKRAEGLVRRGSKRVSIVRGGKIVASMGTFRVPTKRSSKRKSSARETSVRRSSARRTSRRRVSRRRSSPRRVSKSRRRVSRRRSSRRRRSSIR